MTVVTLAQLKKARVLVAEAPSGLEYKIRPLNLERHTLAGGLPSSLRIAALAGAPNGTPDAAAEEQHLAAVREYQDNIVRAMVVQPDLTDADLDVVPPVDYAWLCQIAAGEYDRDGQGRRLWGKEPLSVWGTFRDEHGCPPDCPSCERARRPVADLQPGPDG